MLRNLQNKFKDCVRQVGLLIPWQLEYKEMIHTDDVKCAGFITKCGRTVMYGKEFRRLHSLGRIRGWKSKKKIDNVSSN